jgi:DNA-directed RNA polymerase subunit RPC12/RpoP
MVEKLFKCQMCGTRFQVAVLDRDDPRERDRVGAPVCCPQCGSARVEEVQIIRRMRSAG